MENRPIFLGEVSDGEKKMDGLLSGEIGEDLFHLNLFFFPIINESGGFNYGLSSHRLCIDDNIDIVAEESSQCGKKNGEVEECIDERLRSTVEIKGCDIPMSLGQIPSSCQKAADPFSEPIYEEILRKNARAAVLI